MSGAVSRLRAPRSDVLRGFTLAVHALLAVGLALWSPSRLGLLAAALLLLPMPGLWRRHSYTYAWASMMLAFYCAFLLADGYARPDGRLLAFALAALAAADFIGLVLYVRVRAREQRAPTARTAG